MLFTKIQKNIKDNYLQKDNYKNKISIRNINLY